MTNDVTEIIKALELIHSCCETIDDCGGCEKCPMGTDCFEYNSLLDSYERISMCKWQSFIDYADDVEELMSEESMTSAEMRELDRLDYYDRQRKGERDEKAIAEAERKQAV